MHHTTVPSKLLSASLIVYLPLILKGELLTFLNRKTKASILDETLRK